MYLGYQHQNYAWYEKGGIMAIAHVRGGGEKGEPWYRAGFQQTKPNTWKDFIACAEYLIEKNIPHLRNWRDKALVQPKCNVSKNEPTSSLL